MNSEEVAKAQETLTQQVRIDWMNREAQLLQTATSQMAQKLELLERIAVALERLATHAWSKG
jgi:hypothetical protein